MLTLPVQPMGVRTLPSAAVTPDPMRRMGCKRNLFGTDRNDGDIDKRLEEENLKNIRYIDSRFAIITNYKLDDKNKAMAKCNQEQENLGVDINRISTTTTTTASVTTTSLLCRDMTGPRKRCADSQGIKATYPVRKNIKMRNSNVPVITLVIANNNNNNNNDSSSSNNNNNNAQLKSVNSEIMDKAEESGNNNNNNGNK